MVLHRATYSDGRIGGVSGNANRKGGECIPTGRSATGEGSIFSVIDVPIRMEPDTTDEGTTKDMAQRMAYMALNSHVRNGDERSFVGIRRYNRRRHARPHMIAAGMLAEEILAAGMTNVVGTGDPTDWG
jgi:hypothetical protein